MNEVNLCPEMNEKIADLLIKCDDSPMNLYAGAYIKYLESKLKTAQDEKSLDEGKLLKLPCAVGDEVYTFSYDEILFLHVESFVIYADGIDAKVVSDMEKYKLLKLDLDVADFGKKWFLTREEAETTLKVMSE